jgi:hypothetical protein
VENPTKPSCQEVLDHLLEYCEGDLCENARADYEEHIRTCCTCRGFLEQYRRTSEVCREAFAQKLPDTYRERIVDLVCSALRCKKDK